MDSLVTEGFNLISILLFDEFTKVNKFLFYLVCLFVFVFVIRILKYILSSVKV